MHLVSNINWPISTSLFFLSMPLNGYLQVAFSQWPKETGTSWAQFPLLQPVLHDKADFYLERIFRSTNVIWNTTVYNSFSKIYTNLSVRLSPKSGLVGNHAALANTSHITISLQLSYSYKLLWAMKLRFSPLYLINVVHHGSHQWAKVIGGRC